MNLKQIVVKKNVVGSLVATIGYLLSPLSWWNDLFINIPLSYLLATFLSVFAPDSFSMFMILMYWLTNVLGIVLMHSGVQHIVSDQGVKFSVRNLVIQLIWASFYSLIIAALALSGVLEPPSQYFGN